MNFGALPLEEDEEETEKAERIAQVLREYTIFRRFE
mgnify:FL=1